PRPCVSTSAVAFLTSLPRRIRFWSSGKRNRYQTFPEVTFWGAPMQPFSTLQLTAMVPPGRRRYVTLSGGLPPKRLETAAWALALVSNEPSGWPALFVTCSFVFGSNAYQMGASPVGPNFVSGRLRAAFRSS